jgi:hypothetical protein
VRAEYYPPPCELDAITKATIAACDELDGVKDDILANPESCHFDPRILIGQAVQCTALNNATIHISEEAVEIASATWYGPRDENGKFLWYGVGPGARLNGLASTSCTSVSNVRRGLQMCLRTGFEYLS